MIRNIAIIPARKNSTGFKNKNLKFFDSTALFVKKLKIFDQIITSSNDTRILNKATKYKFEIHKRKKKFSGSKISIKSTLSNIVSEMKLKNNDILWLFYVSLLYRRKSDFLNLKSFVSKKNFKSLCTFKKIKNQDHPYYSWGYNLKKRKIFQYIKNNCYRRQDLPRAYSHIHYISCFKIKELKNLSDELINKNTYPIFLNENLEKKLIEIDTNKDLKAYKKTL